MKRCNKCQLDFADSVTSCRQCGDALVELSQLTDSVVHCTECGTLAKATWKFCKRCGAKMEEVEEARPAASGSSSSQPLQRLSSVLLEGEGIAASGSPPRHPWEPPRIEARNAPVERRCPRCHTALGVEAQFCDVCGAGVREATSRPVSEPTAPVLQEEEPRPAQLVSPIASKPLALTFGGYAEERQLTEAEGLSPGGAEDGQASRD